MLGSIEEKEGENARTGCKTGTDNHSRSIRTFIRIVSVGRILIIGRISLIVSVGGIIVGIGRVIPPRWIVSVVPIRRIIAVGRIVIPIRRVIGIVIASLVRPRLIVARLIVARLIIAGRVLTIVLIAVITVIVVITSVRLAIGGLVRPLVAILIVSTSSLGVHTLIRGLTLTVPSAPCKA